MDFRGDDARMNEMASAVLDDPQVATSPKALREDSHAIKPQLYAVEVDHSRDALLTDFGKETLKDRYLLPGESVSRTCSSVSPRPMPTINGARAAPVRLYQRDCGSCRRRRCLSNGGTGRGLPISCYLNSVPDSLEGIVDTWNENVWLASRGGGIGTYWGNVRGIGEPVGLNGKTSGIIPFVRVMDSLTLAISARDRCGAVRRHAISTCRIPKSRNSSRSGNLRGDFNRKALNLHHGVLLTDAFMEAVRATGATGR